MSSLKSGGTVTSDNFMEVCTVPVPYCSVVTLVVGFIDVSNGYGYDDCAKV